MAQLSFPATEPSDPRRVSEGFQKGFRRVSEGIFEGVSERFSKGSRRVLEGFQKGPHDDDPSKNPSRTLEKPFSDPLRDPF